MTVSSRWCIRCSGSIKWDSYDQQWYCLNCGWREWKPPLDIPQESRPRLESIGKRKEPAK